MTKSPDWVKANEELMQKLVGQSESFIAKVDDFYATVVNKSTPKGFNGAGTYGKIEYNKYGFPEFRDKNPFGDNGIYKKAKGNHTTDFEDAHKWLNDNKIELGIEAVQPLKTKTGKSTSFIYKKDDKWSEPMSWHHHENGKDMFPVLQKIHRESKHVGGVATKKAGLNQLFDY
jgi:hypothetical protein